MSLRRHTLRIVGMLTVLAMAFGVFAGAASAKKLSPRQKAKVRNELRRAVKKNPRVVKRASFLKKASLVNFTLPVTVKLRNDNANNPNNATIDLGASLGQRSIYLGGKLPAEIQFADSYDGGALGNVKLALLEGGGLTTTSIPLLWNTDTSTVPYSTAGSAGCGGFNGAAPVGGIPVVDGLGNPVSPLSNSANATGKAVLAAGLGLGDLSTVPAFPVVPGVDSIAAVTRRQADRQPEQPRVVHALPERRPDSRRAQRSGHGPAHRSAVPGDRVGRHQDRLRRRGFAAGDYRAVRRPGEPVREHPRQGLWH